MSRFSFRGSRVRVNPHNNRAVRLLAVLLAVCCWLSAAGSQPFPSFLIETPSFRSWTFSDVSNTRVAFGPDTGLVVWVQDKTLRGARIDRFGSLLDTVPIEIDEPGAQVNTMMRPAVAWGGDRFLVVWGGPTRAMCALVRPDGSVAQRLVLQDSVIPHSNDAAAAFDGTNFLAVWTSITPSPANVAFFSRVSPSGTILDSLPRRVAPGCSLDNCVCSVFYYANRYLAVWRDQEVGSLYASLILPDGTVPDSQGLHVSPGLHIYYASVTHDSRNFVVGWNENPHRAKLARITDDGQLLDTGGVVIDTFAPWWTALLSVGDTTLAVFCRDSSRYGESLRVAAVRVDTALRKLDATPVFLSPPDSSRASINGPSAPWVALCGGDYLVAWAQPYRVDGKPTNHVAMYRRLNRQGQLVDSAPKPASFSPHQQQEAGVGSDGTDFLAAWVEARRESTAQTWEIRGARFTAGGAVLDSPAFRIGRPRKSAARRVRVAFGGGCYLVAWFGDSSAYAARVSPGGTVLDSAPLRLGGRDTIGWHSFVDVASGDSAFLLVWQAVPESLIHGVRVTPAGAVLDTAPLLLQVNTGYSANAPNVASDGVNFLVVRNDGTYSGTLRCVRVNAAGQILDTTDVTIARIGSAQARPRVVYGHGVYLVTVNGSNKSWRVSPGGRVLDSVWCSYTSNRECGFDGSNFYLLSLPGSYECFFPAMRITPAGVLLDSALFPLVTTPGVSGYGPDIALTSNDQGTVGVACRDFELEPWLTNRVRASVFPTLAGIGGSAVLPVKSKPFATVVRGVLFMEARSEKREARGELLDVSGRRVMNLRPGANDVRSLAPGVYFVRQQSVASSQYSGLPAVSRQSSAVTKVVIAR